MKLTEAELSSPLWEKLEKHFKERLQILRAENDKSLNDTDTAKLRGRIEEVKKTIALGTPQEEIEIE